MFLPLVGLCIIGSEMLKPGLEPLLYRSALARIKTSTVGPVSVGSQMLQSV